MGCHTEDTEGTEGTEEYGKQFSVSSVPSV
jgi:hypothetical protein